jgi:hypothetical protein
MFGIAQYWLENLAVNSGQDNPEELHLCGYKVSVLVDYRSAQTTLNSSYVGRRT